MKNEKCCEGEGVPLKKTRKVNSNVINFAALSDFEQQAFCNFQEKEKHRHLDDIDSIDRDLAIMAQEYGIKPQGVFINTWIEVKR